jgi:hypothetical protein
MKALARKNVGYLVRFNRLLVWPTLVLLIIFVITGFGIDNPTMTSALTGGVFTRGVSLYWHVNLAVPVLILLMIHVLIALKTALIRWGLGEEKLLNIVLIALGVFATVLIILARYLVF